MTPEPGQGRLPAAFMATGGASFTEFVAAHDPQLLPGRRALPGAPAVPTPRAPHGTTIVTLIWADGVLMAGDRRATMGHLIANRDMQKVFAADESSLVGIAGTAGMAIEMVRLLQVELEHYEKIEGVIMSLEGKANRLAAMLRGNLALAMQGLAVLPVFAARDPAGGGRIYSYDVTGGCYEEWDHHSVGSGSSFARGALKKLWRPDLSRREAVRVALEALYDAADDDSATGGPDVHRGIWPIVGIAGEDGTAFVGDGVLEEVVAQILIDRRGNPGGAR